MYNRDGTDFLCIATELDRNGFAILDVGEQLASRLLDVARRIYSLPLRDRLAAVANSDSGILGYYPSEAEGAEAREWADVPLFIGKRSRGYSSFDCLPNDNLVGCSSVLLANKWPRNCDQIDQHVALLYSEMCSWSKEFSVRFFGAIQCSRLSDLQDALASGRCCSVMRFLRYAVDKGELTSKAHTDYELLTIVVASDDGLEVKGSDGKWRLARTRLGQAVVLPGDMCQLLSGGWIKSSLHRVRGGPSQRLSVIFFQGLPLDFKLIELEGRDGWPQSFGEHLLGLLARGSPHLSLRLEEIGRYHKFKIPTENPFKLDK